MNFYNDRIPSLSEIKTELDKFIYSFFLNLTTNYFKELITNDKTTFLLECLNMDKLIEYSDLSDHLFYDESFIDSTIFARELDNEDLEQITSGMMFYMYFTMFQFFIDEIENSTYEEGFDMTEKDSLICKLNLKYNYKIYIFRHELLLYLIFKEINKNEWLMKHGNKIIVDYCIERNEKKMKEEIDSS